MADVPNSPQKTTDVNPEQPAPDIPISLPDPSQSLPSSSTPPPANLNLSPSPNLPQLPPSIQPYSTAIQVPTVPPTAPSFRPVVPLPMPPQFSPIPGSFQPQNPAVQPPGVAPGTTTVSPGLAYPQQLMRPPYMQMPNAYMPMPQGMMPPPGNPRYPAMYPAMVRHVYPPRPIGIVAMNPVLVRPPVPGVRAPLIPPIVRSSGIPSVPPAEKPQTTVYVGKIATTVENEFILPILQLCGLVKSWKRPQDPTTGALKGYGFCEFESADGILRATRLLSKLCIDGQELMLNFNQGTREYLERYVEKKRENIKNSEAAQTVGDQEAKKEEGNATAMEKDDTPNSTEASKEDNDTDKKDQDYANFGLVTDEDREKDCEALEKINGMIEERLKTKPLLPPPPPPPVVTDGPVTSNAEVPAGSRDGDSDGDIMKNDAAEDKTEDELKSAYKYPSDHDKQETVSPERNRKNDRSRDRERDVKREKERELERYEREREQERAKREREREYKTREDERRYRMRVKDWESREKEREQSRKQKREREEERAEERKWKIMDQEHEADDGYSKKREHRSSGEERKRRKREKEDDLADRLKEEEAIAEARLRDEEIRKKQKQEEEDAMKLVSAAATKRSEAALLSDQATLESNKGVVGQSSDGDSDHEHHMTDMVPEYGTGDEVYTDSVALPDTRQNSNGQSRKLGFGLQGLGKRAAVPSVFHEEEDEDAQKKKRMRPLVPIDYSNEELQAGQHGHSGALSPNLAAAAEFAKRISGVKSKEERPEGEKDRTRLSHERYSHQDREYTDHEIRSREGSRKDTVDRDKDRERGSEKVKTPENRKLSDAKQLIDTIPKTKDELFSYKINWVIYDENQLHQRMRPWISKKIQDFLGEEMSLLVDYIVDTTREHVNASEVLERLQDVLDDEAEMFVLQMWRVLIFEIKKVESGLAPRAKA